MSWTQPDQYVEARIREIEETDPNRFNEPLARALAEQEIVKILADEDAAESKQGR